MAVKLVTGGLVLQVEISHLSENSIASKNDMTLIAALCRYEDAERCAIVGPEGSSLRVDYFETESNVDVWNLL